MNSYFKAQIHEQCRVHPSARILNYQEREEAIQVGSDSQILGELLVYWKTGQITIGRRCYVSAGTRIWSQDSIRIGNHVLISHNVDIHDTDSHPLDWAERRLDAAAIYSGGLYDPCLTEHAPVIIEDDAWIGFKATILKGVHIGRGAVVAAGSVVTKDVPPHCVVAGNPARLIRQLPTSVSNSASFSDAEWEKEIQDIELRVGGPGLKATFSSPHFDLQMQVHEKDREIKNLAMACEERLREIEAKEAEIQRLDQACAERLAVIENFHKPVDPST